MGIKQTKLYYQLSQVKKKVIVKGFTLLKAIIPMKILWKKFAQDGELEHHMNNKFRQSEEFMIHTGKLMNQVEYDENSFANKVVADVGSGSKLRSRFFKDAKIIAIDPLNDQFMENIPWSDLKTAYKVFSEPAEEYIGEIAGTCDMVMCINVLDHSYAPTTILDNVYRYLKDSGEFFLSVDINEEIPNPKHPVAFSEEELEEMFFNVGFNIKLKNEYSIDGKKSYGSGTGHAVNYVLIKTGVQ